MKWYTRIFQYWQLRSWRWRKQENCIDKRPRSPSSPQRNDSGLCTGNGLLTLWRTETKGALDVKREGEWWLRRSLWDGEKKSFLLLYHVSTIQQMFGLLFGVGKDKVCPSVSVIRLKNNAVRSNLYPFPIFLFKLRFGKWTSLSTYYEDEQISYLFLQSVIKNAPRGWVK